MVNNDFIKIVDIDIIDEEYNEAVVMIENKGIVFPCFTYDIKFPIDFDFVTFECMTEEQAIISENKDSNIECLDNNFQCKITGKLLDRTKAEVVVNDLKLHVDSTIIPGDIKTGDFIEFKAERIDIEDIT